MGQDKYTIHNVIGVVFTNGRTLTKYSNQYMVMKIDDKGRVSLKTKTSNTDWSKSDDAASTNITSMIDKLNDGSWFVIAENQVAETYPIF